MAQRKKGRDGRAKKETSVEDDGSGLVAVPLSDDEVDQRKDELVNWQRKLETLEEKKKESVKKINAEIKLCKQESRRVSREADEREAFVDRQTALDFGATVPATGGRREGAAAKKAAELEAANDTQTSEAMA